MHLCNSKLAELTTNIADDIKEKEESYKKLERDIIDDLGNDSIDKEEARNEASLRLLDIAQSALLSSKKLGKSIENEEDFTQDELKIINLVREWYEKTKDYYKCKSDFYFYMVGEEKEKSNHIKKELTEIKREISQLVDSINRNDGLKKN